MDGHVLCQGNLHIYAMAASKLVAAMRLADLGCDVDGTKAAGWAKQLDGAALQKLGQAMPVWYHMAKPDEVVYVPTGFMTIERDDNGPLIYGVRKSLFFDTPAAVKNYNQALQLIAQGAATQRRWRRSRSCSSTTGSEAYALRQGIACLGVGGRLLEFKRAHCRSVSCSVKKRVAISCSFPASTAAKASRN